MQARLDEERDHLVPRYLLAHRLLARLDCEPTGRAEHLRKKMDIADSAEEDSGTRKDPVHGRIDVGLLLERLVPRRARALATPPRASRNRLNGLYRYVPLQAHRDHALERSRVVRVLHHDIAVRQKDRVEVETLEAA
jgi:hypothetical protein